MGQERTAESRYAVYDAAESYRKAAVKEMAARRELELALVAAREEGRSIRELADLAGQKRMWVQRALSKRAQWKAERGANPLPGSRA